MTLRHNHRLAFVWHPDCPRCFVRQCFEQCDADMFSFYIRNNDLLTYWEKAQILENYGQ